VIPGSLYQVPEAGKFHTRDPIVLLSLNFRKAIRPGMGVLIDSSPTGTPTGCIHFSPPYKRPSQENASRFTQNVGRQPVPHGL
jgi:hypothetical protein